MFRPGLKVDASESETLQSITWQSTEMKRPAKYGVDSGEGLKVKQDAGQGINDLVGWNSNSNSTSPALPEILSLGLSEPDVQNMIMWQAAEKRLTSRPDMESTATLEACKTPLTITNAPGDDITAKIAGDDKKKTDIMRFFKMRGGAGA